MVDTSIPEEDVEVGPSRTDARKERKAHQARLETLATRLAALPSERLPAFELDEPTAKAVLQLANTRKGSALARQRRHVAKLLRPFDLDALEARLDGISRKPGRSPNH
jgi:ribosomal 50S subunit-associated protein YjgA (DUF615 family)